jgi:hypothetical protein
MRKYYSVARLLLDGWGDPARFAVFLHGIRPLVMPIFAFNWITLATDKALSYALLRREETWPTFTVLLLDFAALLRVIEITGPGVAVYRAFLRFLLVIAHDFSEFLGALAPAIAVVLPTECAQIRNLVLSAPQRSPVLGQEDLLHMLPQKFTLALPQVIVDGAYESQVLNGLIGKMERELDAAAVAAFVTAVCATSIGAQRVDDTPAFALFAEAFQSMSATLANAVISALVDRIRGKSPESSFFVKLLVALFALDVMIVPQLSLSEAVLIVVVQRASTPPPRPAKLGTLVRKLLAPGQTRDIWEMTFVAGTVRRFLQAAQSVYVKKK